MLCESVCVFIRLRVFAVERDKWKNTYSPTRPYHEATVICSPVLYDVADEAADQEFSDEARYLTECKTL